MKYTPEVTKLGLSFLLFPSLHTPHTLGLASLPAPQTFVVKNTIQVFTHILSVLKHTSQVSCNTKSGILGGAVPRAMLVISALLALLATSAAVPTAILSPDEATWSLA